VRRFLLHFSGAVPDQRNVARKSMLCSTSAGLSRPPETKVKMISPRHEGHFEYLCDLHVFGDEIWVIIKHGEVVAGACMCTPALLCLEVAPKICTTWSCVYCDPLEVFYEPSGHRWSVKPAQGKGEGTRKQPFPPPPIGQTNDTTRRKRAQLRQGAFRSLS